MKPITAVVLGAGSRGTIYAGYAKAHPEALQIAAVAEPRADRRTMLAEELHIPNCFASWQELLAQPRMADCAFVCTMDDDHIGPAIRAMELGYHVLLEKPMSNNEAQCRQIVDAANRTGRTLAVCHVLRYTPFYMTLKNLIDQGRIGEVTAINQIENVGYWHQAHSFVRGNWRNTAETSPMILQKSCHDIDILQWLVGKECKKIQSFGSLRYFVPENAPEGAPEVCFEGNCPHEDTCLYSVKRLYKTNNPAFWFKHHVAENANPTDEELDNALRNTRFGKCVYKCENDVVDHQIVNMEFEDGLTVNFTMTAFANDGRQIRLMGTKGELFANVHDKEATFFDYMSGKYTKLPLNISCVDDSIVGGHGGGDQGIIYDLYDYINENIDTKELSEIEISCKNHMLVFAAEHSRLTGTVVDVDEFKKNYKI